MCIWYLLVGCHSCCVLHLYGWHNVKLTSSCWISHLLYSTYISTLQNIPCISGVQAIKKSAQIHFCPKVGPFMGWTKYKAVLCLGHLTIGCYWQYYQLPVLLNREKTSLMAFQSTKCPMFGDLCHFKHKKYSLQDIINTGCQTQK